MTQGTKLHATTAAYVTAASAAEGVNHPEAGLQELTARAERSSVKRNFRALVDSAWNDSATCREDAPTEDAIRRAVAAQVDADPLLAGAAPEQREAAVDERLRNPAVLAAIRAAWDSARERYQLG